MTPTQTARHAIQSAPAKLTAIVAALTAAGWIVVSPAQQVTQLGARVESIAVRQASRDSAQDARVSAMQRETEVALRSMQDDVRALAIERCVQRRLDAALYAMMGCRAKVGRP